MKTTSFTFRLDPETARILKELAQRSNSSRSQAIKRALRAHWQSVRQDSRPTAWEIYAAQKIPRARRHRDRARHVSKLLKEILLAKRRSGTL